MTGKGTQHMKTRPWMLAIGAAGCLALPACVPPQNNAAATDRAGVTATTDAHAFSTGRTSNNARRSDAGQANQNDGR